MLIEIERNRFVVAKPRGPVARSTLPMPHVISDEMPPTEQVDGRFYTSKAAFRRVGRAHGLTEVGTEKLKPKVDATQTREAKEGRRKSLKKAVEKYGAGHRARR
jgi:hypothetical protein